MSAQAQAWAIQQTTGSAVTKAVLMAVANAANHEHRFVLNVERISRETELSPLKIGRALFRLVDLGLIVGNVLQVTDA